MSLTGVMGEGGKGGGSKIDPIFFPFFFNQLFPHDTSTGLGAASRVMRVIRFHKQFGALCETWPSPRKDLGFT